jgi:hypothetical protein
LRLKLNSAERLCAQYDVVVEHLGCVSTPSGDGTVRVVTDELNNRMVFADALRGLLEESDKGGSGRAERLPQRRGQCHGNRA